MEGTREASLMPCLKPYKISSTRFLQQYLVLVIFPYFGSPCQYITLKVNALRIKEREKGATGWQILNFSWKTYWN